MKKGLLIVAVCLSLLVLLPGASVAAKSDKADKGQAFAASLTVTTIGALPEVGNTVVVTGPLTLNKDFGMGYAYDVIVEDAEVKVETAGS